MTPSSCQGKQLDQPRPSAGRSRPLRVCPQPPHIKPGFKVLRGPNPGHCCFKGEGCCREGKERKAGGGQLGWKSRLFTHSTPGIDFHIQHAAGRIGSLRCHGAFQGIPRSVGLEGLNRAGLLLCRQQKARGPTVPAAQGHAVLTAAHETQQRHPWSQAPLTWDSVQVQDGER